MAQGKFELPFHLDMREIMDHTLSGSLRDLLTDLSIAGNLPLPADSPPSNIGEQSDQRVKQLEIGPDKFRWVGIITRTS